MKSITREDAVITLDETGAGGGGGGNTNPAPKP
jgi:hypothetical protein